MSFLTLLRRALRGDEVDATSVPLKTAIAFLAIPMVAEMCMEALFAITDIFWVASLGANAIAVVGITESVVVLLEAVAVGIGMAVTAMVSRRIGEKRPDEAAKVAGQALLLGALVSGVFGVLGLVYAPDILALMGASQDVIDEGGGYTRIVLGGAISIMYLYLIAAAFRGAGEPAIAMRALWFGNGINIVLDPLLIFGVGPFPEMGVEGAGIATVIGRGAGALYLLIKLIGRTSRLPLTWSSLTPDAVVMRRLLSISAGGAAQFLIGSASWIVLMRLVASYGSAAVAGYTLALRIIFTCILPTWGMSNAAATLVGQNLGAGKPERARCGVWLTVKYNTWFLGGMALVFGLGAPLLVSVFTDDPAVSMHAVRCLRTLAVGYVIFGVGMIVIQAFNGAGDTRTPTLLNIVCFWVLQIPIAYLLATWAGMGTGGVFVSIVISETVLTVLAIILFRRGDWQNTAV